jgi:hypothetical protein
LRLRRSRWPERRETSTDGVGELRGEFECTRRARLRFAGERAPEGFVDAIWEREAELASALARSRTQHDLVEQGAPVARRLFERAEERSARQRVKDDERAHEDVRREAPSVAIVELLGREPRQRGIGMPERGGDASVDESNGILRTARDEHVRRREPAMRDAGIVKRVDRAPEMRREVDDLRDPHRPLVRKVREGWLARQRPDEERRTQHGITPDRERRQQIGRDVTRRQRDLLQALDPRPDVLLLRIEDSKHHVSPASRLARIRRRQRTSTERADNRVSPPDERPRIEVGRVHLASLDGRRGMWSTPVRAP